MALKHAIRVISKNAGLTLVATLTLAVAMAGSVMIFSAIDLVLRLAPIEEPDRVVFLEATNPQRGRTRIRVSAPDYFDWRSRNQSFEQLAAFTFSTYTLTGIDQPLRISAVLATSSLFDVWGLRPAAGRHFNTDGFDRG